MERRIENNRLLTTALVLTVLVQLVLITCPAKALIYWTNKDGTGSFFDWSNGGSDKGLFGDPVIVGGNTFTFFPSNFRAESLNGAAAIKSDRLEFCLTAHEGYNITGIRITEYGDYGILDNGKVSVSGTMFVTNLDVFQVSSSNFSSDPVSPISSGQGTWTAEVAVTDIDWTNLKIVLNNNLMAISSAGSTSFIEKKVLGGAVAIELICPNAPQIPEPATICLLGLGALTLVKRKSN